VLDILFASGNPHLPQVVGGVEINTHELACELIHRGYRVGVLAKLSLRSLGGACRAAGAAMIGRNVVIDDRLGYPVFRARRPWEVLAQLPHAAVAIIQNGNMLGFAQAFGRRGVPSVAYFHGLAFESWAEEGAPRGCALPFRGYVANSRFTAARFRQLYGLDAVIVPPLFRRERYRTQVIAGRVSFINPVAAKGVELALEIAARCPEIPFCFVRGWPLSFAEERRLQAAIRRLGNIRLCRRTADMRTIYCRTRILLAPSPSETWGRVVSEAQFSGIPAVTSDRGGLPEAVGPGGIVIGYDQPAAIWAEAIRELWSDAERYRKLSQKALDHAARADLDPDHQVSLLIGALKRCIA
jgi:glycosyltransferase involved in cell wall biosynthesis